MDGKRKFSGQECWQGANCTRKDCFRDHPGDEVKESGVCAVSACEIETPNKRMIYCSEHFKQLKKGESLLMKDGTTRSAPFESGKGGRGPKRHRSGGPRSKEVKAFVARVQGKDGAIMEAKMGPDQIAVMQACLSGAQFVKPEVDAATKAESGFAALQGAIGWHN